MRKTTVAVFFGGRSNEHEISVITGMLAVNLLRERYRVVPVYLPREGGMATGKMRSVSDFGKGKKFPRVRLDGEQLVRERGPRRPIFLDVALNCCHGGAGEDGTLAALLEWNGVKSASPAAAPCALFMDKTISKTAARGLGIPVLPSLDVREEEWSEDPASVKSRVRALGFPVIVKPASLGSSIGVKVARDEEGLASALSLAFRLDEGALVERYLPGKRDLNCAACRVGGEVQISPVEEAFSAEEILTFTEKYEGKELRRSALPANIPVSVAEAVRSATRLLYESFHMRGVVRADFLLAEDRVYFNELNVVPGSLACYLFGPSLSDARDFLVSLVEEGKKPPRKKEIVTTDILSSPVFFRKGCKGR